MSTALIFKKSCERCPAVEEISVTAEDIKSGKANLDTKPSAPKYEVKVAGKTTASYGYLCPACDAAVDKLLTDVCTKREKKTSTRGK